MKGFDFDERPFLVIWETTRACDLACIHCRAEAMPEPDSGELTTAEARKLLGDVAAMKTPIFIFSGGDPLKRADLEELVRDAKALGLKTGVIPAVTPNLTRERLARLKAAGLDQVAFSLDASEETEHDSFRRVSGIFKRTLEAVAWAHELGLAVQINSLINVHNLEKLDALIGLVETLDVVFWEVFFLVPTGRGAELSMLSAQRFEEAFERIYALQKRVSFIVKVTEAPHYRRYVAEIEKRSGAVSAPAHPSRMAEFLARREGPGGSIGQAPRGVNSGKGFVFISRKGEIMPSGFLPLSAGGVRDEDLGRVYRETKLFRELRDPKLLRGKCGICEYADLCGGSRARAYAMTGDYLEEDPCCAFEPR